MGRKGSDLTRLLPAFDNHAAPRGYTCTRFFPLLAPLVVSVGAWVACAARARVGSIAARRRFLNALGHATRLLVKDHKQNNK